MPNLIPPNEAARLEALANFGLLDTPPEPEFERITALAAKFFNVPVAQITLVDTDRLWIKSSYGIAPGEVPRDHTFCAHAALENQPFIVPDATVDARFMGNPLVTGPRHIRFYAGVPLTTRAGAILGALCLVDTVPRPFSDADAATLTQLADMVMAAFEARLTRHRLHEEMVVREQTAQALKLVETRYQRIAENTPGMVYQLLTRTDGSMEFLFVSGGCRKILELEPTLLLRDASEYFKLIHPEDRLIRNRLAAESLVNLEPLRWEGRFLLPGGRTKWLQISTQPERAPDGNILWDGVLLDVTEQRRSEDRLRMLESSVENANDAILITEAEPIDEPGPRVIYVNKAFTATTGYSSAEVLGQTPRILQGLETSQETKDFIRRTLKRWKPVRAELLNYRKDGSEFWVELNIVPVANEQGRYTHWVSVQRDISERKQTEQALKRAGEEAEHAANRVRTVLESISDAFISLDREWRFTYVNYQAERLVQRGRADLIGHSLWEQFPEAVGGVFQTGFLRAVESGELVKFETFYPPLDCWLEVHAYPSSEGLSVYLQDITPRKRAQKELEDSRHLFRSVIEGTDNIIFLKDRANRYVMINPAGAASLKSTPAEVVGKDDGSFFSLEDARAIQEFDAEILRTDRPLTCESSDIIGGVEHVFISTKSPYRDASGNVLGVIGIVREITEQRRAAEGLEKAKEEAERANLAKSEFLSRMSHELRTPLNAILGFSQLLEMSELTVKQRESNAHVLRGGRHLLDLINEVLDIARIEAGKIELAFEPVDVAVALQEAAAMVRPLANQRGITLGIGPAERSLDGVAVLVDRQRLKQVLLNLLSNAIKYNRPSGRVDLAFERASVDGQLRLSVRDTGNGIRPEDLPKLFSPFERLDAANSEVEGTGIGLAISKRLAEAMGGTLGVESEVGHGSTFVLALPIADGVDHLREEQDAPKAYLSADVDTKPATHTVLYIEDNASNMLLVKEVLARRSGIELLGAVTGRIGLELARARQPDLILLDLQLPDLPGDIVLPALKADARTRDIPVILVSADATPTQIRRLLGLGAETYLTKPLDLPAFLRAVDGALTVKRGTEPAMKL